MCKVGWYFSLLITTVFFKHVKCKSWELFRKVYATGTWLHVSPTDVPVGWILPVSTYLYVLKYHQRHNGNEWWRKFVLRAQLVHVLGQKYCWIYCHGYTHTRKHTLKMDGDQCYEMLGDNKLQWSFCMNGQESLIRHTKRMSRRVLLDTPKYCAPQYP